MKKVLILQLLGKSYGGIWQVNRLVGEELIKNNYAVTVLNLRDNKNNFCVEHDDKLIIDTINKKDEWDYPLKSNLLKFKISIFDYFKAMKNIKKDYKNMNEYIKKYKPNYIIVSHYLLLNAIPKEYLKKTVYQQHSSADYALGQRGNRNTLFKFNNKVRFLWLTKASCEKAKERGLNNCYYIYNAVRFDSVKRADVTKNKKLVTIARLSYEKRIDLMINIVNELFINNEYLKDWVLEIYGSGDIESELKKLNYDNNRIKFMGVTKEPKRVLMDSSINLNTSIYEGFSLSILEANECGIPTISFNFGESVQEQIIDSKTGFIVNSETEYKQKLLSLMKDNKKLEKMSIECKKYNEKFKIDKIINDWFDLFYDIDCK
ncbi:MAG: glycosyltransferase [Bacilli bacterium]